MHSASRVIAFCSLLAGASYSQDSQPTAAQLEAFENFATRPTAHISWSKVISRIDAGPSHAVVTALIVDDAAPPRRMRGVRIDVSGADVKDQVYTGEEFLDRLIGALDEVASGSRRDLKPAGIRCFGSGVFWLQAGHALSASQCLSGDSSWLAVGTGRHSVIRFPGLDAGPFASAVAHARDELKRQ